MGCHATSRGVSGAESRKNTGITLLILAPIFYIVYARVILEFFMAVFRLAETNAELVSLKRIEMGLDVPPPAEPVIDIAS